MKGNKVAVSLWTVKLYRLLDKLAQQQSQTNSINKERLIEERTLTNSNESFSNEKRCWLILKT